MSWLRGKERSFIWQIKHHSPERISVFQPKAVIFLLIRLISKSVNNSLFFLKSLFFLGIFCRLGVGTSFHDLRAAGISLWAESLLCPTRRWSQWMAKYSTMQIAVRGQQYLLSWSWFRVLVSVVGRQWVDGMSQNRFPLLLSMVWCSEPVSSIFLQNTPHSSNEVKATQWHACCHSCWLEKHLWLHLCCGFKPKYFICILLPSENPSCSCKLTFALCFLKIPTVIYKWWALMLAQSWESRRLFVSLCSIIYYAALWEV